MKKRNKRKELLNLLQKGWHLSKLQIIDKVGLINSDSRRFTKVLMRSKKLTNIIESENN